MKIPDSFLLDEVRCGFMVPAPIKQAWAAELEVLAEIDRVCRKHNIKYFADWGTLLGAVRHGGFIPWDDDLDIVMKREDYDKFMTVARFDMDEGFDVQTFRNQNDYWLFMGKVVGKNRFCFEKEHLRRFHNFSYIASVDIFVLDYVHADPEKEEKRRNLCKYMLGVADAIVEGSLNAAEREKRLRDIEEMRGISVNRISDAVEMGIYLYGEVEKIFAEVPEQDADVLAQMFPWGLKGTARQYPKEYYAEQIYLPFECTAIPVPLAYDKMLHMRYGDFLKIRKVGGAHDYPFFEGQKKNLQKVLDFKLPEFELDKSRLLRSEEEQAYANMSYKSLAMECANELWKMKEKPVESQQLAIDLGTMLEQMLGEGTVIVRLLEEYCEVMYAVYESNMQGIGVGKQRTRLDVLQEKITMELERIVARKTILFLPVLAKDWTGMYSLWKEAVEACDVYVVPLPYYYKDYDGSSKGLCCDADKFPEEVRVMDFQGLTEEYLDPEVIVIQNPYDAWNPVISVPELYYSRSLRKYTDKLVFMQSFKVDEFTKDDARAYTGMNYYAIMPGVVYADMVIVQSENMRRVYIEKLTECFGEDTREIWDKKIMGIEMPVQDTGAEKPFEKCIQQTQEENIPRKKHILYGVSNGKWSENPVAAKNKYESSVRIFEQCREQMEVTVLHFPEDGVGTSEGFDAFYGDPMPVVVEFVRAGKPVMIQDVNL